MPRGPHCTAPALPLTGVSRRTEADDVVGLLVGVAGAPMVVPCAGVAGTGAGPALLPRAQHWVAVVPVLTPARMRGECHGVHHIPSHHPISSMPCHAMLCHHIPSHYPISFHHILSHPIMSIPSHHIHPIPSYPIPLSHYIPLYPIPSNCIYAVPSHPILRMPCHAVSSHLLPPGSPLAVPSSGVVAAAQAAACLGVALLGVPVALAGPAGRKAPVARLALVTLPAHSTRLAAALPAHSVAQL